MKQKSYKPISLILFFLFVLSSFFVLGLQGNNSTSASGQEEPGASEKEPLPSPFSHLDKLYPPQAKEPVLLMEMIKLAMFYTSVGHDAAQNDWENAERGFENFKGQSIKLSELSPKWKDFYKMDLVEELGRAVTQKNVPVIREVRKNIGEAICEKCHNDYRTPVWYRYHWKDFGKIMVVDPLSQKKFPYFVFMTLVSKSFQGIKIDILQNQPANAQKAFKAFTARVEAGKQVCKECHDPKQGESKSFVSPDVMEMIDGLGAEISKPTPAHDKVDGLFMGVGVEMCYKCHQVHMPAAVTQKFWRKELSD
jgi:hypothetical protein